MGVDWFNVKLIIPYEVFFVNKIKVHIFYKSLNNKTVLLLIIIVHFAQLSNVSQNPHKNDRTVTEYSPVKRRYI